MTQYIALSTVRSLLGLTIEDCERLGTQERVRSREATFSAEEWVKSGSGKNSLAVRSRHATAAHHRRVAEAMWLLSEKNGECPR